MTKKEICDMYGIYPHVDDETDWNRELTEKEAKEWCETLERLMDIIEKYLTRLDEEKEC